jgi:TolB-like protein
MPKQDYFSDGISEELLNALSRLNDLQVVARTSSFSFKGQNVDVSTIAHKLNVGAVLEGSVRRAGNTVRITAQLINTVTGFHLWSETYDRPFSDILKVQTEVATAVAQQLEIKLAGDESSQIRVCWRYDQNPDALRCLPARPTLAMTRQPVYEPADWRAALAGHRPGHRARSRLRWTHTRRLGASIFANLTYISSPDERSIASLREQALAAAEHAVVAGTGVRRGTCSSRTHPFEEDFSLDFFGGRSRIRPRPGARAGQCVGATQCRRQHRSPGSL